MLRVRKGACPCSEEISERGAIPWTGLPSQEREVDTLRLDFLAPGWSEMMSREKIDSWVQQFRRELRRFIPVSISTISQPCSYVSQGEEDQVLAPATDRSAASSRSPAIHSKHPRPSLCILPPCRVPVALGRERPPPTDAGVGHVSAGHNRCVPPPGHGDGSGAECTSGAVPRGC